MYGVIIVPLDGSRGSNKAVDHALAIAKQFDSEVILMRIATPSRANIAPVGMPQQVAPSEVVWEAMEDENRRNLARVRDYLNSKRRQLRAAGVKANVYAAIGAPAEQILKVANQEKADLIVMTTRGRGGIKRALLGSVADEVIRSATAPTLVIRR